MNRFSNFSEAYYSLINQVYSDYEYESAPRGMKIREKLAVKFVIENPRDRLLYIPGRDFSMTYTIAEALWYLLGENSTEWISNYAPFWRNISDDGKTANSAYGARIFKNHPRIAGGMQNQWEFVKEELRNDPDSRRAIIHIHTPDDSLYAKKDIPCTLSLQFLIRNKQLHMIVQMRSSDLILGITYDIPAFTLFQELMANQLGLELGTYTHISNSLHIYERDFQLCQEILAGGIHNGPQMPAMPCDPPLDFLNGIQALAKSVISEEGLESIQKTIKSASKQSGNTNGIDDYWIDWALILLAHRAGKLKQPSHKKMLFDLTSFAGYKSFTR